MAISSTSHSPHPTHTRPSNARSDPRARRRSTARSRDSSSMPSPPDRGRTAPANWNATTPCSSRDTDPGKVTLRRDYHGSKVSEAIEKRLRQRLHVPFRHREEEQHLKQVIIGERIGPRVSSFSRILVWGRRFRQIHSGRALPPPAGCSAVVPVETNARGRISDPNLGTY